MTIATDTLKNALTAAYATRCAYASLHSAAPGTNGANEIVGGTYVRVAVVWSTPNAGTITASVTINVPAGQTVAYGGLWDSSVGGTFQDDGPVATQQFNVPGSYTVNFSFTQN